LLGGPGLGLTRRSVVTYPGLVEIFDYGHVLHGPYPALEVISGPTLHGLIAAGPLVFAETMRIG
jgi:hypothetical protein